jgi:hypothetical protein
MTLLSRSYIAVAHGTADTQFAKNVKLFINSDGILNTPALRLRQPTPLNNDNDNNN